MAPGRVNLIGEYTDFNEGFVFPMTVDRGVYVGIRARTDQQVRVFSSRFDELIEHHFDEFKPPESGHWSCYVLGVVEELRVLGLVPHGFDAVIDGNLNLGAGLSSSAALEMATALALQTLFGFEMSRVDVATLCQRVEHRYAGLCRCYVRHHGSIRQWSRAQRSCFIARLQDVVTCEHPRGTR